MDHTTRFDGRAGDYAAGRPTYAEKLIDHLYDRVIPKGATIADIGSGTGKFAKHLLDRGSNVCCVEPNDDMRREAESELSRYQGFRSVNGNAEHTTLGDGSVDIVTTAQAFHWFDTQKFRRECTRIMRHGGKAVLIWNIRDPEQLINRELKSIYTKYCPRFGGFSGGIEKDDIRIKEFFGGRYDYVSFDNPMTYDRDRFIARSLSSSYSLKEGDDRYGEYIDALTELFERCAEGGTVYVTYRSAAYIGE